MEETKLFAKKRDKKVYITDIAIEKIPLIQYKGLNDRENDVLYQLAKLVLLTSQTENDSNEVVITCTLSIEDVRFFLHFESIRIMVVVTNQGTVHYLCKDKEYNYNASMELYSECIVGLTAKSEVQEYYMASLTFLTRCSEVGLFYH